MPKAPLSSENRQSPLAPSLDGDRPVRDIAEDRLGFNDMAKAFSASILAQTPTPGLVVGLQGPWGSGKSSLLNLTLLELANASVGQRVKVLEFRPWLIGDRDWLLASLFTELAGVIDKIEAEAGDLTGVSVTGAKSAGTAIRNFARRLSGPGKLLTAAKAFIPFGELGGEILTKIAEVASEEVNGPTLAELKDKLTKSLEALGAPIVVTIDDVDRLEPKEVLELLRLVRSVADLPNVIYVLCYDHNVLARAIENAANVSDGSAFLEKIIQVVVQTPIPESYDLRFWFTRELESITGPLPPDEISRIKSVIDSEGGRRLTTPRAVVRALNSLRFDLPALAGRIDLADLVWLHLIKASNSRLYRWIEAYSTRYAATWRSRAHLSKAGIKADNDALREILSAEGRVLQDEVYSFANHLPGFRRMVLDPKEETTFIWGDESDAERDRAVRARRLSSPDHYRLYFALAIPGVAPQSEDFTALSAALKESETAVEQLFLQWAADKASTGVSRLELVFDRLNGSHQLPKADFAKFWITVSNIFDGPVADAVLDHWGSPKLWDLVEPILANGFRDMPEKRRTNMAKDAFEHGQALAFLAHLFRTELFAHGRIEARTSGDRQILTGADLDIVTPLLLKRFRRAGAKGLLSLREGHGNLLAWYDGAAEKDASNPARLATQKLAETDLGLVQVLEALRTLTSGSNRDGITRISAYLARNSVERFLDFDEAKARLDGIISGRKTLLKPRAQRLLQDISRSRNY